RTVLLGCLLLLPAAGFAAELNVIVTDAHSAPVPNARVEVFRGDSDVVSVQSTGTDGKALVRQLSPGRYSVRVLAPGFGAQKHSLEFPQESSLTFKLAPAVPGETVVVTATRTPVNPYESGAAVLTLESDELENKQPISAAEALRFLPGAIITNLGQRGGLTSLFVRGGGAPPKQMPIRGGPAHAVGGGVYTGTLAR